MSDSNKSVTYKELAPLVALAGIVISVPVRAFDAPDSLFIITVGLLAAAVVMWVAGDRPIHADTAGAQDFGNTAFTAPRSDSLAGAQVKITRYGDVFSILNVAVPAVATGGVGRTQVSAVDEAGRVGELFLGLDVNGEVIAASIDGEAWEAAQRIS